MFIEKHINQYVGDRFDQSKWRQRNTFKLEVDNVLKAYSKIWEQLYNRHSGKHALPGQKPFMMVDEFDDFRR